MESVPADGSAWAKALRRESLALEKHVSVAGGYAGPVEASEPRKRPSTFSLRVIGSHRGRKRLRGEVRFALLKDKPLASREGLQKAGGELEGVKVVQASDNGGSDSGRGRGEVLERS